MIVDLHTHIWESPDQLGRGAAQRVLRNVTQPWDRPDASTTAHDAAMEPVQHAVILGYESQFLGGHISSEQVAKNVARKPGKYLGFAGIDPFAGDVVAKVNHAKSLGLVGVTISPAAQGFHPTHTRAMKLYERCSDLGMPLLVHAVTHLPAEAMLEFSQPYLLDEVAREFPKLRIVVAQVGHPWIEQTLVLIGKHRNVFADLSNVVTRPLQLYNLLLSAHQQGVTDRLLFGSDFPFCTPQKAITTIYSVNTLTQGTMLPSVPREQLRSIVERDTLEALGLRKAPEQAKPAAVTPAITTTAVETKTASAPSTTAPAKPVAIPASGNGSHHAGGEVKPAVLDTPPAAAPVAPPAAAALATDDHSTVIDPYDLDETKDEDTRETESKTDRPQG